MNRPTAVVLATAALTAAGHSAALAQAIHFDIPRIPFAGETETITMSASFNPLDYAIAGVGTSVVINEIQGGLSNARLVAPMAGPGTSEGIIGVASVDGILAGQLNFPPAGIYADPTNPIAFWQVDWTYAPTGGGVLLDIESQTDRFDVYTDRLLARSEFRIDELEEGSLRIVIPAPAGAFALLGGLALVGRRRR